MVSDGEGIYVGLAGAQVGHAPDGKNVAGKEFVVFGRPTGIDCLGELPVVVVLFDADVATAEDLGRRAPVTRFAARGCLGRIVAQHVASSLRHENLLAVQAVSPGFLPHELESGGYPGSGPGARPGCCAVGVALVRCPVAVVVGVVIDRHAGPVNRVDVIAHGVHFLGERRFAVLLAAPPGVGQGFGRIELAAV